jgi:hypothetical protein
LTQFPRSNITLEEPEPRRKKSGKLVQQRRLKTGVHRAKHMNVTKSTYIEEEVIKDDIQPTGLFFRLMPTMTSPAGCLISHQDALTEITKNKVLFFGELRGHPQSIALLKQILQNLVDSDNTVHVVLEHFSFEMQYLLNDYCLANIEWEDLLIGYKAIGTEQHDIRHFRPVFALARASAGRVNLHAGVMPWPFAAISLRPIGGMSHELALKMAKARGYIDQDERG